jgi:hypothetical protein
MPLPASIATIASFAGFVTATKSAWELSRMLRRKYGDTVDTRAKTLSIKMQRAYDAGDMRSSDFFFWHEKLLDAKDNNDRKYGVDHQLPIYVRN